MTPPAEDDVSRAVAAALRGELIGLPTDTVYGIGTRPDDQAATARLFDAKRRPRDLELPVLVPNLDVARRIGRLRDTGLRLAERFWPGALTVVVERTEASASWDLGGNRATVGIRVPDDPTALAVLQETGPLAVTSANISGSPTPSSCHEIAQLFGDLVAVTLCSPGELSGHASTVVDCTTDPPTTLRTGAIGPEDLQAVVRRVG
jgi:tRNA threonylcarbamoyl adenosine modification protein (Sua5/YciO/YrdC/YwlC family)